ncbi:hypothetical protein D3C76_1812440 [compost metagenome]
MDLRFVLRHRGVDTEGLDTPFQIRRPVATTQRQTFTQRRFINLDDANTGGFQIGDFVTKCQRNLLSDGFAGHIFARE